MDLKVVAEYLFDKFVMRTDVYAVQSASGGYVKVEQSLMCETIQAHLRGEKTIGVYQLDQGNMVKWLCFDFDPEKLSAPKQATQELLKVFFEKKLDEDTVERPRVWPHAVVLEASRYPDPSFHVWILFSLPVGAKAGRWLGMRLLELANLNPKQVELFPKQTELSKDQPYGNLVKLPLGFHQVEHKWSRLLDFENFQPMPNNILSEKWGLSFSEADLNRITSFEDKKHVQALLTMPQDYRPMKKQEEEAAVKFLVKYWRRGYRNQLEFAFLGLCIKKGVSYEAARRIIERVCDLTSDEEKQARLRLVDYHYHKRRSLGGKLQAVSGLREIVGGLMG